MFGIGLPEMILILILALIVVGPDKLPELARSTAKVFFELKKTAEGLKESIEEHNPLEETKKELEDAANNFKNNLLETPDIGEHLKQNPVANEASSAYQELMKNIQKPLETDSFIDLNEQEPNSEKGEESPKSVAKEDK